MRFRQTDGWTNRSSLVTTIQTPGWKKASQQSSWEYKLSYVAGAQSSAQTTHHSSQSYKKKEYTCRFCSSPYLQPYCSVCPSVSGLSNPSSTRFSRENREGCGEQRRDEEEEDRAGLPPDHAGAARRRRGCALPACNTQPIDVREHVKCVRVQNIFLCRDVRNPW
jgi:hypothetical protein